MLSRTFHLFSKEGKQPLLCMYVCTVCMYVYICMYVCTDDSTTYVCSNFHCMIYGIARMKRNMRLSRVLYVCMYVCMCTDDSSCVSTYVVIPL